MAPMTVRYVGTRQSTSPWRTHVVVTVRFACTAAHARQTSPSRSDLLDILTRIQAGAQAYLVEAFAALSTENEVR